MVVNYQKRLRVVPVVVVVVGALVVITLLLIILVVIVIVYRADIIVTVINTYCSKVIGVSGSSSFCCSYRREHLSQAN
jgi:hypothetical protein